MQMRMEFKSGMTWLQWALLFVKGFFCGIHHCQAQVQLASSVQIQLKTEISLIIRSLYQYLMPHKSPCMHKCCAFWTKKVIYFLNWSEFSASWNTTLERFSSLTKGTMLHELFTLWQRPSSRVFTFMPTSIKSSGGGSNTQRSSRVWSRSWTWTRWEGVAWIPYRWTWPS